MRENSFGSTELMLHLYLLHCMCLRAHIFVKRACHLLKCSDGFLSLRVKSDSPAQLRPSVLPPASSTTPSFQPPGLFSILQMSFVLLLLEQDLCQSCYLLKEYLHSSIRSALPGKVPSLPAFQLQREPSLTLPANILEGYSLSHHCIPPSPITSTPFAISHQPQRFIDEYTAPLFH